MSTFIGVGYIVYALITVPMMVAQAATVASWYPPVGVALVFGPGLMLLGARVVDEPVRWITGWALACPVGVVLGAALWGALRVGTSPDPAIWMLDFAGLAAVAAALVSSIPKTLPVIVLVKSAAAYVAVAHQDPRDVPEMAREALFGILFTSLFVCAAVMVVRTGTDLDRSRSAAAAVVEAHLRNAELARFDGLIHDHVISTLVAAGSNPGDPRVADLAASALSRLDALAGDPAPEDEQVTDRELVARVRAVIDPGIDTVVTAVDDSSGLLFPAVVVRALAEAAGEAVRNSATHAGPGAERAVLITVGAERVAVAVVDDGIGFDPDAVAVDRLGLALSVRRRMNVLAGGRADVQSAPGAGTVVEVSWSRP